MFFVFPLSIVFVLIGVVLAQGGLAALALGDALRAKLPASARVKVASLAGYFPAWGKLKHHMKQTAELHQIPGPVHAHELLPNMRVPVMLLQSSYDR